MTEEPFDLRLRLLDRQVVDPDGRMVCKVDDVELAWHADGSCVVTALLAGPLALGPRLPGRLGRWVVALGRRWSPDGPRRIPFDLVTDLGSAISVSRTRQELGVGVLEDWVREHVVDHIPGSRHAGR